MADVKIHRDILNSAKTGEFFTIKPTDFVETISEALSAEGNETYDWDKSPLNESQKKTICMDAFMGLSPNSQNAILCKLLNVFINDIYDNVTDIKVLQLAQSVIKQYK